MAVYTPKVEIPLWLAQDIVKGWDDDENPEGLGDSISLLKNYIPSSKETLDSLAVGAIFLAKLKRGGWQRFLKTRETASVMNLDSAKTVKLELIDLETIDAITLLPALPLYGDDE